MQPAPRPTATRIDTARVHYCLTGRHQVKGDTHLLDTAGRVRRYTGAAGQAIAVLASVPTAAQFYDWQEAGPRPWGDSDFAQFLASEGRLVMLTRDALIPDAVLECCRIVLATPAEGVRAAGGVDWVLLSGHATLAEGVAHAAIRHRTRVAGVLAALAEELIDALRVGLVRLDAAEPAETWPLPAAR